MTEPQVNNLNLASFQAAHQRIAPYIHKTPLLTSQLLDAQLGVNLFLKCENFQKIGAFKARGACNAVFGLEDSVKTVATHSSGNHAAALAYAASKRGMASHVVMPNNAPAVKRAAVLAYGATIIDCEPTQQARESVLASVVEQTSAEYIPPFNDLRVIEGQGTVALEIYDQLPRKIDSLLVPVGGGGLLSGSSMVSKFLSPGVSVIACEPEGADDARQSFYSGQRIQLSEVDTIADGLRTSLGDITYPIICKYVDDVLTVSDEAIVDAMRLVWTRMKIIIEPSSAVVVAVLQQYPERFKGQNVAAVITGGNVDLGNLPF